MYVITDELHPDWHMKEFYSRNILLPYAFTTDASEYTRYMSSELITVDDINNSFDDITYDKGMLLQLKITLKVLIEINFHCSKLCS